MEIKRVKDFRIGLFATGHYLCTCTKCNSHFEGDKRAMVCLDCIIEEYNNLQLENTQLKIDIEAFVKKES